MGAMWWNGATVKYEGESRGQHIFDFLTACVLRRVQLRPRSGIASGAGCLHNAPAHTSPGTSFAKGLCGDPRRDGA